MGKASRRKEKTLRETRQSGLEVKKRYGLAAAFLLITLTSLLIYSSTFSFPFHFDDEPNITLNDKLRDLTNFWPPSGTRYIGVLSFALNYHFGKLDVFGYHLVNITIHIMNGLLVWWLVILTFETPIMERFSNTSSLKNFIALFSSLIFTIHPVQTQAIAYIVQRFASLATLFYLLSLVLYIKARLLNQTATSTGQNSNQKENHIKIKFALCYLTSVASAILAMKTKEIAFTLPFIVVLYEFIFFSRPNFERWISNLKRLYFIIPFLATLFIIPLSIIGTDKPLGDIMGELREAAQETEEIPRGVYFLTQFRVIATYIRLLFLPIKQNLDYDYSLSYSLFDLKTLISFLFLLSIFVVALYLLKKSWKTHNSFGLLASFGILWFFITLSIESSIIPIRDIAFEHRLYLPSVGAIIAFSSAVFYALVHRKPKPTPLFTACVLIIIAVPLGVGAYHRNFVWKNEVALWEDVVRKSPDKARGHNNLGLAYYKKGRVEEAIQEYLTAIKLKPDYLEAHQNLGGTYAKQGRLDEAIQEYLTALKLQPNYPGAHNNLGLAYYNQGRPEEAIKEFTAALRLNPDFAEAHYNIGLVYYSQGRLDEAIQEYTTALKLKPDYLEAHQNLAGVYYHQGRMDEAIQELMTALRLNPNLPDTHYNLGNIYKAKGLKDVAKREFETVLELRPNDQKARQAIESLGQY